LQVNTDFSGWGRPTRSHRNREPNHPLFVNWDTRPQAPNRPSARWGGGGDSTDAASKPARRSQVAENAGSHRNMLYCIIFHISVGE
jgi:hypothetical protein